MKSLYLYTLCIFALIFFYGFLRLFFDARKSFRQSRNYIFAKALGAILVFYMIRFGIGDQLLQLVVVTLHYMDWTDLTELPSSNGWTNTIADALFLFAVLGIVGFYTWSDLRQSKLMEGRIESYEKEVVKIQFPKEPEPVNPVFHERIKDLFEKKHQSDNLQLQYDSKTNILYGTYQSVFHHFLKMIYCHESVKGEHIKAQVIENTFNHIKSQIQNFIPTEDTLLEAYYVLDKGSFEESELKIKTLTEDDLLNQLIDFKPYLKKLIHAYENDRLFSIQQVESKKPTLAQTFVPPTYTLGKNKENTHQNLDAYVDNWLTQDSQKHLVVLGDYGMGKTSFMKHYAAKLAADILEKGEMRRFPVLISLTNTSLRHGGIDKSIGDFLSKNIGVKVEVFNELVRRGKVVFLLDGFDEMGYLGTLDQRIKQLNEIWQLPQKNNKVVISGRPSYFFKDEELKEAFNIKEDEIYQAATENPYFERLTLQPLENETIQTSIAKYYDEEKAKEYMEFIQSNSSILDLCRRPQLMHLVRDMLPELLENHQKEKLNASELMKLYINRWMERQIGKGIVSAVEQKATKTKFALDFFTDLAALYYERDIEQLPAKDILDLLEKKMKVLQLDNQEDKEGFKNEMLNGFLIERRSDEFKFVHKSFKEYLVAQKILQLIEEKNFKHPLIEEKDWTSEVINFFYDKMIHIKTKKNIPLLLELTTQIKNRPIQANLILSLTNKNFIFSTKIFYAFRNLFITAQKSTYIFVKKICDFRFLSSLGYIKPIRSMSIEDIQKSTMARKRIYIIFNIIIIIICFIFITVIGGITLFYANESLDTVLPLLTVFSLNIFILLFILLSNIYIQIKNKNTLFVKAWYIALLKGQFRKEDYPEMVYYLEHYFNKKL